MAKFLSVKTKRGVKTFRRAGYEFSEAPTLIPLEGTDEEKITTLRAEGELGTSLIVEEVEGAAGVRETKAGALDQSDPFSGDAPTEGEGEGGDEPHTRRKRHR